MTTAKWLLLTFLLLLAAVALAVVLTPALRERIQATMISSEREILATAEGDLLRDGSIVKVVKIRQGEGIWVEVLKDSGPNKLIDRILLPDKHDGLFNYQGHVTRLAIADIDGDGLMELLAPTFDQQLIPHLNVFRFNVDQKKFEPVNPAP